MLFVISRYPDSDWYRPGDRCGVWPLYAGVGDGLHEKVSSL